MCEETNQFGLKMVITWLIPSRFADDVIRKWKKAAATITTENVWALVSEHKNKKDLQFDNLVRFISRLARMGRLESLLSSLWKRGTETNSDVFHISRLPELQRGKASL